MNVALAALGALVLGLVMGRWAGHLRRRARAVRDRHEGRTRDILLPFTGQAISRRALQAALRLARVENATLMPAFMATVPRNLSLDSPLPRQCTLGMPLLETIEQRALVAGVPVDSRVIRGRSYRHALSRLLASEHFDRVIISATENSRLGLSGDDVLWVLERADAEVMILRPSPDDHRVITPTGIVGHF